MTNSASSSKTSITQEVENPSSFNFSIPPPNESPSTPVYGVGETDKSTTPILPSEEILPCSPTLVLSHDKSQNSEAQSIAKLGDDLSTEVAFRAVSSIMSERFFEGDLPEGRGPESNILAAGAEMVAAQSLASIRENTQPTYSEPDERSHEQTERTRKRRREGHEPEQPNSTSLSIGSSETESEDIANCVVRRRKEGEEEKLESKKVKMTVKKTPAKREKVKRRTTVKPTRTKGPGPSTENLSDDEEMSREDRIVEMEKQKVLNGRVFDPEIHTAFGMSNLFDAISLQEWGHLFEPLTPYLYESEVWEYYYKMDLLEDGGVKTTVHDVEIVLDEETLGIILGVPVKGV
ncbi:hypothetical protein H5410_006020 [Solanum commersonii]|uniref:Uncharacterized protein n=1 Tax=Solanum commersonii TaxID=4109 RepID=A0A9J6A953_SOLCO|nr:hypothetical protein H5410_006020 [Solanum commersonii]